MTVAELIRLLQEAIDNGASPDLLVRINDPIGHAIAPVRGYTVVGTQWVDLATHSDVMGWDLTYPGLPK